CVSCVARCPLGALKVPSPPRRISVIRLQGVWVSTGYRRPSVRLISFPVKHSHGLTGEIFAIAPITLVLSIFVPQSKPSRRCFQRFKRDSTHLKVVAPVQLKCFAVTPL